MHHTGKTSLQQKTAAGFSTGRGHIKNNRMN